MAQNNGEMKPNGVSNMAILEKQLFLMRDAFRQHQNEVRRKYKISSTEMEIILYISEHGPQRMKSVGESFDIKFSTLTSLVDKIERLNLVKRVNSKEDRRSILITLTSKGRKMLEEYNSQITHLAEKISDSTQEDSIQALLHSLEKVNV